MPATPLLLSLPPRLTRTDQSGAEIGDAYQAQCAQSWRAAGFEPVSINAAQELADSPALLDRANALGIRIISVERDARAITGRSHVYLSDVLREADRLANGGAFALTNADILIPDANAFTLASALQPGTFAALPRIDVTALRAGRGPVNQHGFDLFTAHAADARALPDIGLIIGAPWWDHYFPILLRLAGVRRIADSAPIVHLVHDERWNWPVWAALGHHCAIAAHDYALSRGEAAYATAIRAALERSRGKRAALDDIALINIGFLAGELKRAPSA